MARRHAEGTAVVSAGAGRAFRLDPFRLPARVDYAAAARAGQAEHSAVIGPESVHIRRLTAIGVPIYVTVPLRAYRGVLLRAEGALEGRVALRLEHVDMALAVPLFAADDTDDVIAEWQAWGRALGRPLLIEDADGLIREPQARLGGVLVKPPRARRVNRFFAERRPRFLCRRKVGGPPGGPVHCEDEIIARDTAD